MQVTRSNDVVSIKELQEYVVKLSKSAGLTEDIRNLIHDQISQLAVIYGENIQREVAIRILQTQMEMTKTGYFQEPVDIVEFVESPNYMNQKNFVRPKIMEHLIRLWRDPYKYIEVVCGGSLTLDTLIQEADGGLPTIQERLGKSKPVLVAKDSGIETSTTDITHVSGQKHVRTIVLQNGMKLTSSMDHRHHIYKKKYDMVKAQFLQIGERVVVPRYIQTSPSTDIPKAEARFLGHKCSTDSYNEVIPVKVTTSPNNKVAEFLRTLFSCRSTVIYTGQEKLVPGICLAMSSERFIRQTQLLLLRFKIQSAIRFEEQFDKRYNKGIYRWELRILGIQNLSLFISKITEIIEKQDKFYLIQQYCNDTGLGLNTDIDDRLSKEFPEDLAYIPIIKIIDHSIKRETGDLGAHNGNRYIANGISTHNSIGYGKNYFLDMSMAYFLYRLSCLYSPQAHFGLAPGSDIVFLFQSRTYEAARKVIFNQFKQRIEASKYFAENYMFEKKASASELKFPNNVRVRPVSSTDTAALSLNVLGSALDELNFLSVINRSAKATGPHQETYDQAQKLYQTVYDRIESRYKTSTGMLGKIFMLSSANYQGDFIDRKEEEAKTNPTIYVMHMAQWESAPWKYSKERFYVKLPTQSHTAEILDKKPVNMDGHIAVPMDLKSAFIANPEESLRSRAGIAIISQHKFLSIYDIVTTHKNYNLIYTNTQIFNTPTVCINNIRDLKTIINWDFVKSLVPYGPFSCHIDLGLSSDAAGIAIGHVIGGLALSTTEDNEEFMPVYGIPGVLACTPPVNAAEDIDIIKIRDLLFLLKETLPIEVLTMDQFQSEAILQAARKKGFRANKLSVDKTPEPYLDYKQAVRERRVYLPEHKELDTEYKGLDQDLISGKIDHSTKSSKDIADAVTGCVYTLSILRTTYSRVQKVVRPIYQEEGGGTPENILDKHSRWAAQDRPSSGNRR